MWPASGCSRRSGSTAEIAPNEAAAERAAVNLLLSNPDAYFEPGAAESFDFEMVSSGSGFFVSEDGYLVTAAHVVAPDRNEVRMTSKLLAYVASISRGNQPAACGQLGALVNYVNAQSGKQIPAADAPPLLTDAASLAIASGC